MDQNVETIEQSEHRFRSIVSLAADAIICIDASQRITMFNHGAEHIFGYSRDEIIGERLDRLIPARFRGQHRHLVNGFKDGETSARLMGEREAIFALRRNGEEFPAEATISKTQMGGISMLTVILRDATERRDAEALLEARVAERTQALETEMRQHAQAQAKLVRAQRMEAFGQLTGGVAHDFNNLLTVIAGNLELLAETELDERQRKLLQRSLNASGLGARLTQRLLTFARRSRLAPSHLDLNAEVTGVIELLRRTLGEMVHISTELAPGLWTIRADASEVESAIVNLSINARDAMPGGGRLSIRTSNVSIDDAAANSKLYEDLSPGNFVCLSVSDTGTGMAPDVLQRAFEPFFTTKEPGRGTGLGLATIYGFAKQSSGHLTIYSELGIGTTVSLYLPKADLDKDAPAEPAAAALDQQGQGRLILLVEDNLDVREVTFERLQRLGFGVVACDSGPAAIKALGEGYAIDLVFSDIIMAGGMSGYDLSAWLAKNRPDLPVLLASGFAEQIAGTGLDGRKEIKILRKPYSTAELLREIQLCLSGQR